METLAYLAPALGCVLMMGPIMWMMRRGRGPQQPTVQETGERPGLDQTQQDEVRALREELAALRHEVMEAPPSDG